MEKGKWGIGILSLVLGLGLFTLDARADDWDRDGDGLWDDWEINCAVTTTVLPDLADGDYDDDNLTDLQEFNYSIGPTWACNPDPLDDDSDDDGLYDGTEDSNGDAVLDLSETDPNVFDTDLDGLHDGSSAHLNSVRNWTAGVTWQRI